MNGPWSKAFKGQPLVGISGDGKYQQNFNAGTTLYGPKLFARQHADYGGGKFDPHTGQAYEIGGGVLNITAYKDEKGDVRCGNVQTVTIDQAGSGAPMTTANSFSQAGGYWEAKIRFPRAQGTWGGFWLLSPDDPKSRGHLELDVIEYYGEGDAKGHHHSFHRWHYAGQKDVHSSHYTGVPELADFKWHTHGVDLRGISELDGRKAVVFYQDRKEVARFAADDEFFQSRFYWLLTLNMQAPVKPEYTLPQTMQVDYVRVWR
ncbi:family 16 glycosylhydrolase [Sphingobium phenoxybenzoativorans]|uniref:Family 16 glycosylhydrolase n=1 Tax=Sphingobium phenoxybenzoativorans TaxID=1592790 RepID=A0A975K7E5_9SPHN|nr:family 16 glycosylhydrolase [Sphingobium phenoxybenzoativorans]QUT04837.1 family 16 glycosylhydrolase [Sphingobium phenoxybenzoativorans]